MLTHEVMLNQDNVLPFNEFLKRKNNFHLHFAGEPGTHLVGDIYRQQNAYVECKKANPRAFANITRELTSASDHDSPDYLRKLYAAYLMMYQYAERNRDMFM